MSNLYQNFFLYLTLHLMLTTYLAECKNINLSTDNDLVNSNKLTPDTATVGSSSGEDKDGHFTIANEIKVLYKLYEQCNLNNKDLLLCLKLKLVNAIDKLNNNGHIQVLRGIYLVKDESPSGSMTTTTPHVDDVNGTEDEQRSLNVDGLISNKIYDFFKSRSLSLKLFELDNAQNEENQVSERKKKDKGSQWMLWPFLMGGMMIPLSFMALALLAGKALILAKLALALSAILGLKKLSSHGGGGGGGHDSYQVVSHGGGSHYRRSLPLDDFQAQSLAYKAYLADVTELGADQKTE